MGFEKASSIFLFFGSTFSNEGRVIQIGILFPTHSHEKITRSTNYKSRSCFECYPSKGPLASSKSSSKQLTAWQIFRLLASKASTLCASNSKLFTSPRLCADHSFCERLSVFLAGQVDLDGHKTGRTAFWLAPTYFGTTLKRSKLFFFINTEKSITIFHNNRRISRKYTAISTESEATGNKWVSTLEKCCYMFYLVRRKRKYQEQEKNDLYSYIHFPISSPSLSPSPCRSRCLCANSSRRWVLRRAISPKKTPACWVLLGFCLFSKGFPRR